MTAPRGLSRPTTSFIGLSCQGIHRVPLQHTQKTLTRQNQKIKMLASTIQFSNNTPHTQSPTTITASNPTWSKKQHATHKATSAVPDTQQCTNAPFSSSNVKHQTISFHALPSAATPPPLGEGVHPPKNNACSTQKNNKLLRKEVIQPHLPVRLPCYDLVPIADPTFDSSLHKG